MIVEMDDLHRRKQEVCDLIRRKIGGAGLSLAEVDRRAGWSAGYLSQVLNGHNSFRLEHLLQLSEILELSLSELFAAPSTPAKEGSGEVLPGGVEMGSFMELLEREVEKAVAARLGTKERDSDSESEETR